ncbi:MAG: YebC/PmpR family DNA-binding transcriptional regulator [Patescibacteria group bacterium]
MSGHSKWETTHRQKEATDAKRGHLFTKLSKNISLSAKKNGDIETNFSLRMAVDKAKEANMPKDNIEKAIKRGTGEIEGLTYEGVFYEAYGGHGVALIIEGVTDKKNRTTPEVKSILTKFGGSLGGQNSVQWMFNHQGVIRIESIEVKDKDSLIMEFLENGAEDVVEEEGGLTVFCGFTDFEKIKKFLETKNIKPSYSEVEWLAKEKVKLSDDDKASVEKMLTLLEENEDINDVYSNLEV